jgi:hypothetical protein
MDYYDLKHYEIDGLKIEWVKTLNEVRPMLEQFVKLAPDSFQPKLRCRCSIAFGLHVIEIKIGASFEDKPVSYVRYELSPIKTDSFATLHVPYLECLEKNFGKPIYFKHYHKQPPFGKKYLSNVNVFDATWKIGNSFITLCVYATPRTSDSGLSGANILIERKDEVKLNQVVVKNPEPPRKRNENLEKIISEQVKNGISLKKFTIRYKQRSSESTLNKAMMFQTPDEIQAQLKENEIGLYRIESLNLTFISDKWDTIFLSPNDEKKLVFYDTLPAKGPGSYYLKLGDMDFGTSRDSAVLLDLVQAIEAETGMKVSREQYRDE